MLETYLNMGVMNISNLPINIPSQFLQISGWTPSFSITRQSNGSYTTDFDPSTLKPSGTTMWVSTTGNNSNDGLTEGNAKRSIDAAIVAGATVVNVKAGRYSRANGFNVNINPSSDVAIVAIDGVGTVYIDQAEQGLSWTQQSAPNDDVYLTTRSAVHEVVDMTNGQTGKYLKDGTTEVPIKLTLQASIADCQANPGSYFTSGSNLYVHTHDSREPDSDVVVLLTEGVTQITNDIVFYIEGCEVWGVRAINWNHPNSSNNATFVSVDSAFRYSSTDAVSLDDIEYAYSIRSHATDSDDDGFNYHHNDASAPAMRILEVDCCGDRNGMSGESNANGSSAHADCSIIRLNGNYRDNYGPNVVDIDDALVLNLGVNTEDSQAPTGTSNTGFSVSGGAIMWMRDCTSTGSDYDRVVASGSSLIDFGGFSGDASNGDSGHITTIVNWLSGIDNVIAYWDFADGTKISDDGTITIQDKSGNGHTLTQSTAANKPVIKGDHLSFEGNDFLEGSSGLYELSSQNYTMLVIARQDAIGTNQRMVCTTIASGSTRTNLQFNTNAVSFQNNSVGNTIVRGSGFTVTDLNIIMAQRENTTQKVLVNGDTAASEEEATDEDSIATFIVGANGLGTSSFLVGDIYGIVLLGEDGSGNAHSDTDINTIANRIDTQFGTSWTDL